MKDDSDSMKKYQEDAESWTAYSRMQARRLRPDAELTEGATNGCEDKKEFSDEIPSSTRSANVGRIAAQLLLKEVGWYFIFLNTLKQPFDLHPSTLLSLIEVKK